MGCGTSKAKSDTELIIDKNIDWVKTVETGQKVNSYNRNQDPKSKRTRQRPKFEAKFDARVTAKYDIKALIGKGSYSRVVRVEHIATKQPYAIKMVEKKQIEGKLVQSWEIELNILKRVRHTNIIQLIEVFHGRGHVYMVMELATGGELFDRIVSKGHFTERDATVVLRMLLDALRYIHNLGITHRDVKPENMLYYHPGNDSKIMITDFGLASCRTSGDDSSMMNTVCGTPEYIAPEILLRKKYNQAVDIWATGVVAYILLSGRMPFDDESRTRLYRKIVRAKYSFSGEPWKDVSPAAKDFLNKVLIVNPAERLTSAQCLKHPWIASNASQSNLKNLHRSISQNWLKRTSTRSRSSRSAHSNRSAKSQRSGKSMRSSRSQRLPPLRKLPDVKDVSRTGSDSSTKPKDSTKQNGV
ncbi:Serine/threonine-protein kinase H1 [Holothuria leucospilota]|uniref:Serine/threonine-protein kinase H1 n=1 Tax=Holothuria leucospilota TaxID=206669 RepID=A0A9Q1HED9_HOLLE|nr:Serine/threonine-protein kinase H1 [Holothuria leucospilota]